MTSLPETSHVVQAWRSSASRQRLRQAGKALVRAAKTSRLARGTVGSRDLTSSSSLLAALEHRVLRPVDRGARSAKLAAPSTPQATFAGGLLVTLAIVVAAVAATAWLPWAFLAAACLALPGVLLLGLDDLDTAIEGSWILSGRLSPHGWTGER